MLERVQNKGNTPPLLVGVQTNTVTVEINMAHSQKTENQYTLTPNNTSPGNIPKRCSVLKQGHLLNYVHSSFIHNSQNPKTT